MRRGKKRRKKRMGKIKNNGKEKKENIKGNRKKRNEGRVLWVFLSLIHVTKSGEAILPNVLLKWFQLHPQIRFTSTATAGAATTTATNVPNTP
jgi:hypothetical protein